MRAPSFLKRKPRAHTYPHVKPAAMPVNVTVTEREPTVDALEFTRDPATIKHIRDHLPNAASPNLTACRHAAVLDKQAAFLADRSGKVEPPERWEVVEACRFAAEHIRDGIVIGATHA